MPQPTLAISWASSCGGCDVALLDLDHQLLELAAHYRIVYWPCAMDQKRSDLESLADGSIDLCLFNGAIRTSDDESLAHLLRRKSRTLVAFGSCAHEGCVPGLANLSTRQEIFEETYIHAASTRNDGLVFPVPRTTSAETELELPRFLESLRTLDQTVTVDAIIPGCPPEPATIVAGLAALGDGAGTGAVLGDGTSTCCDECPGAGERRPSAASAVSTSLSPTPRSVSWTRGSSAWDRPHAAAAERSA